MKVIKRSGKREEISYDKITKRVEALCHNVEPKLDMRYINPSAVTREVVGGIFSGISTESLDTLTADICASKIMEHPDYNKLAARITISNLHKKTKDWTDIAVVSEMLYRHVDKAGRVIPMINEKTYRIIRENADRLNAAIDFDRDYRSDFFSIKTLERAYLKRIKNRDPSLMKNIIKLPEKASENPKLKHEMDILRKEFDDILEKGIVVERPQHMWMRVSIGIHGDDIERAIETYNLLSLGFFTHATPTLFNSGSDYGNLSSCFLLGMGDSVRGIFKTLSDCGEISKRAGGIGVHISGVRASGSEIRTTNGRSNGIVPFCKLLNDTALAINQGGKRPGSVAVYLETHHADIFEFCELRLRTGTEMNRARDLFLALWVSDLFMKRVENGEEWSLFCPDECPGLNTCHGEEYERLYLQYESNPTLVRKRIPAQKLWFHILECQIETGMPYMAFKDNANNRNNQKNLGTIRSSNLCCEIFEYSDEKEYATCNLASISLPAFVKREEGGDKVSFDYERLVHVARVATRNLNQIIDINYYPVPETKLSNDRHRPIGVGVQGLADVFALFGFAFFSDEARELNVKIFETIYYGCLLESVELAKVDGPYSTFVGSPFSEGKLQYDLWGLNEDDLLTDWDWAGLKRDIMKFGTRNSLLTALMPTASTSQILCNNECFEPFTTNLYTRATSAGDYIILNKYLVDDLIRLDLWDEEMREELLFFGGSVQNIDRIPAKIRHRYMTSFELPQRSIIDLSIDRGPFIDQSQSLNIFIPEPDYDRLTSCHFHAWEGGLKTGMYYLRSRPAVDPIKFGLDPESVERIKNKYGMGSVASTASADVYQPCEMCSA